MSSFLVRLFKLSLVAIILITITVVVIIETTLQPILHSICKTTITGSVTSIIHRAVNNQTNALSYNDLVTIQTNRQGEIILMQPNLQAVNDLSSNITLAIQQALEQKQEQRVKIPISQIFGIEILSQFIPLLTARMIPYGSVQSNLKDQFESVGINQTKHKIYLQIVSRVKVVIPMVSTGIKVATKVPLTEAVIVGQVPEVYVGLEKGMFTEEQGLINQTE